MRGGGSGVRPVHPSAKRVEGEGEEVGEGAEEVSSSTPLIIDPSASGPLTGEMKEVCRKFEATL